MPDESTTEGSVYVSPAKRQRQMNARLREAIIAEFGIINEAQVLETCGIDTEELAGLVRDKRVFAVDQDEAAVYLRWQLDQGKVREEIGPVLVRLPGEMSDWGKAAWFVNPNSTLEWERPVDVLGENPELVQKAAERETREWAYTQD